MSPILLVLLGQLVLLDCVLLLAIWTSLFERGSTSQSRFCMLFLESAINSYRGLSGCLLLACICWCRGTLLAAYVLVILNEVGNPLLEAVGISLKLLLFI